MRCSFTARVTLAVAVVILPVACTASPACAQALASARADAPPTALTAADSAGIRTAALDYIDGWYTADAARMSRALHPELAKRNVMTDSTGRSRLSQMSALTLINSTHNGGGSRVPVAERRSEVTILDGYAGAASARVMAAGWVDYMHLARYNGRWVIVNVLWEMTPQAQMSAQR